MEKYNGVEIIQVDGKFGLLDTRNDVVSKIRFRTLKAAQKLAQTISEENDRLDKD